MSASWLDPLFRLAFRCAHRAQLVWWRLVPSYGHGAGVVLRCGDDILIVQESYRRGLGIPAGGRDGCERDEETACRELAEEVGISLPVERLVRRGSISLRFEHREVTTVVFEAHVPRHLEARPDRREILWAGWRCRRHLETERLHPALRWYLETAKLSNW